MHFKLNIKAETDRINFSDSSALIKFFIDSKKLDSVLNGFYKSLNFSLSKIQRKSFLDKKADELIYYSEKGEPSILFLKKIKVDEDFTPDFFRNYFAGLIPSLKKKHLNSVHVILPVYSRFKDYFETETYFVQTMIEGVLLGNYTFDNYKSEKEKIEKLDFIFHCSDKKFLAKAIDNSQKIIDSVYFTRDLVNEPAITLTPMELASRAKKELKQFGVAVKVFDKKELERRKMNAILAVGGASANPPCMIVAHYKPKLKPKRKIALVGKGVTYDSGGLSIKPTAGMLEMKADMAGGAVVLGIIRNAALLKLPVEIIGVVPAVENMIGGNSFKPGDVIKASSGRTFEVKDTDAEGRVVLADALHFASLQKPDEIIDFATLTGACAVALGLFTAGLFTSNDKLAVDLTNSGSKTFERIWRLPFWKEFSSLIKSDIADVSNLGPRWGGAITAGKFLEHFVDKKIPWAHLDIAGPSIKHESTNYTKNYDTGFGVRFVTDYLINRVS
ncbi:MAG: leucyl aminopeptidase [Melioribacteraceae bacterium]|nr:leucyl aminopeptidase [Melioribacteraceae bacterium]